jgi:TolB protein
LFVIGADGTGQRRLTPWTLGANGTPDWSRTGLIVFRAVQDEESGIGNFFTIHPDGTGLTQVSHFTGEVISHKVGFSADGKWIVFGKRTDGGSNDLFLSKIDGTAMHPVTRTPPEEGAPDWTASTS